MKKIMKRMMSFIIAAMMIVAMAVPAMADEYSITINAPGSEVTLVGNTYDVYKLFDVTYSGDAYAYSLAKEFEKFTYSVNNTTYDATRSATTGEESIVQYVSTLQQDSKAINDFATAVKIYITTNNIEPSATKTAAANEDKTVKIDVTDPGYYIVTGSAKSSADTDKTVVALNALTTTNPAATVTLKADAPTIKKEAAEKGKTDYKENAVSYSVGDSVPFKLTCYIPSAESMEGYETYIYKIHDVMDTNLSLVNESVKVYGDSDLKNEITEGFIVSAPTTKFDDGCSFEVTVKSSYAKDHAQQTFYIGYNAILGEGAITAAADNSAHIQYSNNPYDTASTTTTPDKHVKVYTYSFNIFKFYEETNTDTGITKQPLAGAEFKLYADSDERNQIGLVSGTTSGHYRVAKSSETTYVNAVSLENGSIVIDGLAANTYYLKEVVAPNGYNLLKSKIQIVVEANEINQAVVTYKSLDASEDTALNTTTNNVVPVENKAGSILPSTGGMGTTIFTIIGIVLMAGAAIVLITKKRLSNKQ